MGGSWDGPPVVALPERMDRRLRLGPFPSARDALKFLAYAAAGALAAALGFPLVGLAAVLAGFAVAVLRIEGQGIDRLALSFVRFYFGRRGWSGRMPSRVSSTLGRGGVAAAGDGRYAAVVRAGGTPMAYLPPAEIARRFDLFRELLRASDGELTILGSLAPMRSTLVVPAPAGGERRDRAARDGYADLVRMLCDRRRIRRVDVMLISDRAGSEGIADLELRTRSLLERMASLELPATRLLGRALADAVRRSGRTAARRSP
jgi:hypothetical protein